VSNIDTANAEDWKKGVVCIELNTACCSDPDWKNGVVCVEFKKLTACDVLLKNGAVTVVEKNDCDAPCVTNTTCAAILKD
jgi:hypothetical protein